MRKQILGAAAVFVLGVGVASAADLRTPVYKAPQALPPAFSWTGFYIGANVGYGFEANDDSDKLKGVIGGGQIGYNWQTGAFVWGIEVDGQGSDQHASTVQTIATPIGTLTGAASARLPWFATARGRLGWTFADHWMAYVTGGGGVVDVKTAVSVTGPGITPASSTTETTRGAWVVGGGIEQAFLQNWSWKFEYLYMESDSFSTTLVTSAGPVTASNLRVKDNIVRVGVNYHF